VAVEAGLSDRGGNDRNNYEHNHEAERRMKSRMPICMRIVRNGLSLFGGFAKLYSSQCRGSETHE